MRIGIDLGGSKIAAIALTSADEVRAERRMATPAGDYAGIITAVVALVDAIEAECRTTGSIGIGTPGAISPASGLIKNSNSVCLNGKPLQRDLEQALGRPVRLANDADCFTLSEANAGAAAGAHSVFGVIIGTGTGGGIVIDGSLLTGPNAIVGEWGHNPLPWPQPDELPGPPCYCGKHGCIETFVSGPGMAMDYRMTSGQQLAAVDIAARAAQGDALARATLHRYTDRLARSLAGIINVLDPEVIVLGGGMSNITALYASVPSLWGRYVFSDRVDTRLVPARYGDASGVRGAAWLWPA